MKRITYENRYAPENSVHWPILKARQEQWEQSAKENPAEVKLYRDYMAAEEAAIKRAT